MGKASGFSIKFDEDYLQSLVETDNSGVFLDNCQYHIALHPAQLGSFKSSIADELGRKIAKYDKSFDGILLGFKNVKSTSTLGTIGMDNSFVHIDVNADCFIFRPQIGMILKGVVTRGTNHHVGCLVYNTFNVSLTNINSDQNWKGSNANPGDQVGFEITFVDQESRMLYIKGKLLSLKKRKQQIDPISGNNINSETPSGSQERKMSIHFNGSNLTDNNNFVDDVGGEMSPPPRLEQKKKKKKKADNMLDKSEELENSNTTNRSLEKTKQIDPISGNNIDSETPSRSRKRKMQIHFDDSNLKDASSFIDDFGGEISPPPQLEEKKKKKKSAESIFIKPEELENSNIKNSSLKKRTQQTDSISENNTDSETPNGSQKKKKHINFDDSILKNNSFVEEVSGEISPPSQLEEKTKKKKSAESIIIKTEELENLNIKNRSLKKRKQQIDPISENNVDSETPNGSRKRKTEIHFDDSNLKYDNFVEGVGGEISTPPQLEKKKKQKIKSESILVKSEEL